MRAVPPKRQRARTAEQVRTAYVALSGGEDLVSPALSINPGALTFSENYEPGLVYGYRRVDGFERADGRPVPSDATYVVIAFNNGSIEPAVEEAIVGVTSGATGIVLNVSVTSGSWAGGDAVGTLAIGKIVGTFINNEPLGILSGGFNAGFSSGFA